MMSRNILLVVLFALLTGCSQGDDKSINSEWKPSQEVIVINGHTLPPEPNPAINNATLLGIDSNGNGVRDDVEIWIYTTYDKPIEHAVFMQSARAYQIVIVEPVMALDTMHYLDDVGACISYYKRWADKFDEELLIDRYRDFEKEIQSIQFNTSERFVAYEKYNQELSGGIYVSAKPEEKKAKCDFDTSQYEKKQ